MLNPNISKIYLASKSPRRRELLAQMGVNFEVLGLEIPEQVAVGEDYATYSQRISQAKASAAWAHLHEFKRPLHPVLSADTEVVIDDIILGKPQDDADALRMWRLLSGRRHLVITTISLKFHDFEYTHSSQSWVYVDQVTDAEIQPYLTSGDYRDKSGGYGIQSYAGQFIQRIDGCFYSIMGLPLNQVRHALSKLAAHVN